MVSLAEDEGADVLLSLEVHSPKSHYELSRCSDVGRWEHNPLLSTILVL